jgi:hypothetical protein
MRASISGVLVSLIGEKRRFCLQVKKTDKMKQKQTKKRREDFREKFKEDKLKKEEVRLCG